MSRTPRAESNIKVKVIDASSLEKQAFELLKEKKDAANKDLVGTTILYTWGYVETPNGTYLLCDEGVGDKKPVSEQNPAEFMFNKDFSRDGAKSMELAPSIGLRLSEAELKELPVKEVVTLDKFIRTFGSRLEVNYETWQAVLSKEMKKKPVKA